MFVLDTNTVSSLMRGEATTVTRLAASKRQDVLLPQPVIAEIEYGIARLPMSARRERLGERWELISNELSRITWDDAVSTCFGRIKADLEDRGALIEDFDIAIAAHALAWDATLVSSNAKHFERIHDLKLEDWKRAS